ncbi:helix-turn-helix domain-containing protein [Halomonas huangheensis]|uniref:HTH cro/C1-type domain-containing protein n=1 Tax=Halomonas huangheensis TaxID=1178482 RepID=W1NBD0_9GAMM|nr:helix-turn-helix transcriptional regulator [Halomonas huangheensis]ALM52655.1 XRE family transcriptional regulator [Halomonas huangheensis]ERL52824.1 hypothetical protein BJB45_16225 [Halomonas huangheensis]
MKHTPLTPEQLEALLQEHLQRLFDGRSTQGEVLSELRRKVLGFNQTQYAELVGISRRTLSDIERDSSNVTVATLSRVFRPLGLQPGLMPRRKSLLTALVSPEASDSSS